MAAVRLNKDILALPALIAREGGEPHEVTIMNLSEARCLIQEQLPAADGDDAMQVWIGAIGPLLARRSAHSASEIEFVGPINPAIVEHFSA